MILLDWVAENDVCDFRRPGGLAIELYQFKAHLEAMLAEDVVLASMCLHLDHLVQMQSRCIRHLHSDQGLYPEERLVFRGPAQTAWPYYRVSLDLTVSWCNFGERSQCRRAPTVIELPWETLIRTSFRASSLQTLSTFLRSLGLLQPILLKRILIKWAPENKQKKTSSQPKCKG